VRPPTRQRVRLPRARRRRVSALRPDSGATPSRRRGAMLRTGCVSFG
jgi:hypothetical protein